MKIKDIELTWLGHSGFLIQGAGTIYIDPYNLYNTSIKADFILLTHSHYDHCSYEDLKKIIRPGTVIIATPDCQSRLTKFDVPIQLELIEPGEEFVFGMIKIFAVPAYNIDSEFHKKDENLVGYFLKLKNVLIYHSGDSDFIPEMKKLSGFGGQGKTFVALLPVSGKFTMNSEEAFEAAKIIHPDLAIPMHYGSVVGDLSCAEDFVERCLEGGIRAKILEKS